MAIIDQSYQKLLDVLGVESKDKLSWTDQLRGVFWGAKWRTFRVQTEERQKLVYLNVYTITKALGTNPFASRWVWTRKATVDSIATQNTQYLWNQYLKPCGQQLREIYIEETRREGAALGKQYSWGRFCTALRLSRPTLEFIERYLSPCSKNHKKGLVKIFIDIQDSRWVSPELFPKNTPLFGDASSGEAITRMDTTAARKGFLERIRPWIQTEQDIPSQERLWEDGAWDSYTKTEQACHDVLSRAIRSVNHEEHLQMRKAYGLPPIHFQRTHTGVNPSAISSSSE